MSEPRVIITLGRSGQKVVKTQQTGSGGSRTDYQSLSGGKRSASQRFRSNTGGSLLASNKRLRGDFGACSPDYNRVHDARVGRNDLRLKLMRKERLKRIQSEVEARKKMYLHEKMSIWSTDRRQLRHTSPIKRSGEMLQAESLRKPYPSYNGDPLKPRFPERVLKVSRETSPPRHIDELQRFPSRRPSDTSRNGQHLDYVLYPSRIIGPASVTMGATHDTGKPVTGPPPASALPNASYTVDMAALKQMGDKDLKELGIPMGPRKKILLALLPRSKQQKW
ncbi:hypothetical protein HYC85_002953 [Camellia sinensis]|uniref:SAM domain-containing protein n=1 Tax=Camellia sinensis TaxID=4442 RepID=A0A7J7IBD9_CAMSI|nr:hypothetical protein HYC85_002953 [Camellia sinensis]